ncbi:rCG64277 [Rattus norvegicus]|uniref:RCG64277 n=1 Tax=Rattus norvegicus TaxID=10116 RepID=A6JI72_RAT|nr:rCG64277 [Rattus norvegicus]
MRCHLEIQLSSGLIITMIPSNEELVQSYTISLLPFICRYASQLSHPSHSNRSIS